MIVRRLPVSDGWQNEVLDVFHDGLPVFAVLWRRFWQEFSHVARRNVGQDSVVADVQHVIGDEVHHIFG